MKDVELFDLIARLKEAGVTHFKNADIELVLTPKTQSAPPANLTPVSLEIPPGEPDQEPPHIVQQMKSLLKLSDEELIEQLFPLPKPLDEELN
jgi:hypothetical protein